MAGGRPHREPRTHASVLASRPAMTLTMIFAATQPPSPTAGASSNGSNGSWGLIRAPPSSTEVCTGSAPS